MRHRLRYVFSAFEEHRAQENRCMTEVVQFKEALDAPTVAQLRLQQKSSEADSRSEIRNPPCPLIPLSIRTRPATKSGISDGRLNPLSIRGCRTTCEDRGRRRPYAIVSIPSPFGAVEQRKDRKCIYTRGRTFQSPLHSGLSNNLSCVSWRVGASL